MHTCAAFVIGTAGAKGSVVDRKGLLHDLKSLAVLALFAISGAHIIVVMTVRTPSARKERGHNGVFMKIANCTTSRGLARPYGTATGDIHTTLPMQLRSPRPAIIIPLHYLPTSQGRSPASIYSHCPGTQEAKASSMPGHALRRESRRSPSGQRFGNSPATSRGAYSLARTLNLTLALALALAQTREKKLE